MAKVGHCLPKPNLWSGGKLCCCVGQVFFKRDNFFFFGQELVLSGSFQTCCFHFLRPVFFMFPNCELLTLAYSYLFFKFKSLLAMLEDIL